MYMEFIEGEKHGGYNPVLSNTHDNFKDAGYVLTDDDLVVDIDSLDKDTIRKMLDTFNIKTQTVWTERGVHLYFKKPSTFRGAKKICALGFEIEFKHSKNTKAVTIKRNGILRTIENEGIRESLPEVFALNKRFESLLGMNEGDGRNNALFEHR
ncbi:MAG: hypothetical protein K0M69_11355, partial [Youngiibacter sp.]|nr:hypothetical protein [Youngiibacter sp.]